MSIWRLLNTGTLPGALNMAIDQALLKLHVLGLSPPTLRFYQWQPPAVSIGYFQQPEAMNLSLCPSQGIDLIRRPTGGRAVLHQNDLTYSLISGTEEGIPSSLPEAYHLICEGLLSGFRWLGIEATMGQERLSGPLPEICFLRSSIGDIVCHGKKFVGNAQMWSGSSLLQHGSIILEPQNDTWADLVVMNPDSREGFQAELESRTTSLLELLGYKIETDRIIAAIEKGMALILGVTFETGQLSSEEWSLAQKFAQAK
jgi:lipoate-protein ligase A